MLVLALAAPALCRRLSPGDLAEHDRTGAPDHSGAEHHAHHELPAAEDDLSGAVVTAESRLENEESTSNGSRERYGFLPTPNVATPILNHFILPPTFPGGSHHESIPAAGPTHGTDHTDHTTDTHHTPDTHHVQDTSNAHDHEDFDMPRHKHRRKIKINDDGTLWTKYPNVKHLVEIVPIKHKSNTKGKALAYIVPKSHGIKKKLSNQKIISGIVVDRNMPDLSEVLESSEENPSTDSSESISIDSESDSDQEENTSSDGPTDDTQIKRGQEKTVAYEYDSEDKINDKLNDIVSYFKAHKDANLDSVIHDVLPDDEVNPEYHVHYIIHKKHRPHNSVSTNNGHTHHNKNNTFHVDDQPNENDVGQKQNHIPSHSNNHDHNDKDENYHDNVKVKDKTENSAQNLIHYAHIIKEHDANPHHNTLHVNHDIKHDVIPPTHDSDTSHTHSSEELEDITLDDDKSISIESIEQLHDLIHDAEIDPELNKLYDILNEVEIDPGHITLTDHEETPEKHHIHVYSVSNEDSNDQSDDSNDHSVGHTIENYSNSFSDEVTSDESQYAIDFSNSKAKDSIDSSYASQSISNSDQDSSEEFLYHSDSPEFTKNEYHESISTEDVPDQSIEENDIVDSATQESGSSESSEPDSGQHDSSAALTDTDSSTQNDLKGHDFIFPNCLKTKKKKAVRKCDNDCKGHKSYTLTFLFNR